MALQYKLLTLLLFPIAYPASAQHPPVFEGMTTDTTSISLGDLEVKLVKYSYEVPNVSFLAIHDNEDTGVKAAFQFIEWNGGTIVDSQYDGARNFKFVNEEETFETDPNSIYTRTGVKAGLQKYGIWDDNVVDMLSDAGKTILKTYDPKKTGYIFTLHNNADGGFGITSYLPGYDLEDTADSVNINFEMDPDDMVLVTEIPVFNLLKKANVNVILQAQSASDDGSLSIYAMQQHIPYINVEVQHGHIEENLRLIELCSAALAQTYPAFGLKKGISPR